MRFFTADTHFTLCDYHGVVERDFRPFKSPRKMNRAIIRIWNRQARRGDVIYHLGDFANYNKEDNSSYKKTYKFVRKIKASVVLIFGNNEEKVLKHEFNGDYNAFEKFLYDCGFAKVVQKGIHIDIDGKKFYLNHLPKNHEEGCINLFGHIHGSCFVKKYGFNVGIDNHYLRLFSEEDIKRMVQSIPYFDENVYE